MKKIITLLLILTNFIFSIDYNTEIQPIFNTNCVNCHSYGSNSFNNHQLDLTSYSTLMSGGESGDVIVSGDSTNSILFQKISDGSMPPYGSGLNLTAYEISLIAQWISEGAFEEEDTTGCTDPDAINYNPEATIDDDSCEYEIVEPAPAPVIASDVILNEDLYYIDLFWYESEFSNDNDIFGIELDNWPANFPQTPENSPQSR